MPAETWEQIGRLIEKQFEDLHRRHDETNEELRRTHDATDRRIDELTEQIREQNGRVRKNEILSAAHEADFITVKGDIKDVKQEIRQIGKLPRTIFGDLKVLLMLAVGVVTATVTVLAFLGRLK